MQSAGGGLKRLVECRSEASARAKMSEAGFTEWENFQNAVGGGGCHPQAKLGGGLKRLVECRSAASDRAKTSEAGFAEWEDFQNSGGGGATLKRSLGVD